MRQSSTESKKKCISSIVTQPNNSGVGVHCAHAVCKLGYWLSGTEIETAKWWILFTSILFRGNIPRRWQRLRHPSHSKGRHTWRWHASPCRRTPINFNFPGTQNWNPYSDTAKTTLRWLHLPPVNAIYLTLFHLSLCPLSAIATSSWRCHFRKVICLMLTRRDARYCCAGISKQPNNYKYLPFFPSPSFHPVGSLGQFISPLRSTLRYEGKIER